MKGERQQTIHRRLAFVFHWLGQPSRDPLSNRHDDELAPVRVQEADERLRDLAS